MLKQIRLKDIAAKIGSGSTPKGGKKSYSDSGVTLIRSLNIYDYTFSYKNLAFINEDQARKLDGVKIEKEDILLNITGASVGRCTMVPEHLLPARVNQHVSIIRVDKSKADPNFLLYCINSPDYKNTLLAVSDNGATREALTKDDIERFQILLPELDVQIQIGAVLKSYDDLIKVNNRRINLLEETSKELYKEWFVRMRFPGFNAAKFKRGIPTNWTQKAIGKVIDHSIGGGWGNDKQSVDFPTSGYVIRGTDIPNIRIGITNKEVYRFHKTSNMKSRQLFEGDIIFETAGGSEGQPLGRTCYITQEILDAYGDKVMAASFCKQIRTNSIPSLYLYYFINYLYDTGMVETFQVQSTGISNYQFEPFLKFQQILLPPTDLMQLFHDKVITIQRQIATLGSQNENLRQIRDRLLPRLIGGKLEIKPHNKPHKIVPITVASKSLSNKSEVPNNANVFFKRRVLAAHIIDNLRNENTFGHVKLMKLMYLSEQLAQIDTASNYHRDAAGPYDNRMIRSIDTQLKKAQWFDCTKVEQRYTYQPLSKSNEYKEWFDKYYGDKKESIAALLRLFGKEKTEKVEMVATLYEAFRDLNTKTDSVTDDEVINEVLNNWHDSKKRIPKDKWNLCLQWMKEKGWIR